MEHSFTAEFLLRTSQRAAEQTERKAERKLLKRAAQLRAMPDLYPADVLWHMRDRADGTQDAARVERLIADGRLTA